MQAGCCHQGETKSGAAVVELLDDLGRSGKPREGSSKAGLLAPRRCITAGLELEAPASVGELEPGCRRVFPLPAALMSIRCFELVGGGDGTGGS